MPDPFESALNQVRPNMSWLQHRMLLADDDRKGLLQDIDDTFYGGGHAQPKPSPTPSPIRAPHFLASNMRYGVMSTDNPNTEISARELVMPPRQIPLNQLPPSRSELEMQEWYHNLINRFISRPDVQRQAQFSF